MNLRQPLLLGAFEEGLLAVMQISAAPQSACVCCGSPVWVCRCSVTCCWEWSVGAYYVVSSHLQLTWALCSLPTPGHLDGWCVDVKLSRWLLCLRLSCSGLFRGMELSSGHLHTASCVSELWFCPLHLVDEKDAFQVLFCTLVGLLLE